MNADHDLDLTIPEPHATIPSGPARVGAELRAVRERLGWRLPDLAARLKIRQVFLEAIETGDLSALPAPAYAAGFIRSYAEAVGLDPEEILRRFRAEGMSRPKQPSLSFPEPVPDRAVPPGAIVFLIAVIGIGAYFLWYRHSEHELKMAQMVPAVPARLAPLAVPKPAPAPAPTATSASPTLTAPASTTPAPTSSTSTSSSPTSSTRIAAPPSGANLPPDAASLARTAGSGTTPGGSQSTAVVAPPPSATPANRASTPTATSPATPPTALAISATTESWVQVRGPRGTILFSRLLKAGQSWPVPDEPGLTLTTGNAGGTELVRNGVAGPPLGAAGAVLHNVPLTPATGAASTDSTSGPTPVPTPVPTSGPTSGTARKAPVQ